MTTTARSTGRPVTPVTILGAELLDLLGTAPLEDAARARLARCARLAADLEPYLQQHTSPPSPALRELEDATRAFDWATARSDGTTAPAMESEMLSGHVEARLLQMLVKVARARRVLEVGLFTGYSALAMSEALPADGELVACEVDPFVASFAQRHFERCGPAGARIRVEVGPAATTLEDLAARDERFDVAFVDADKQGYAAYYERLVGDGLVRPGGLILVDNTLYQGEVYVGADSANGEAIARFNRLVADDPRVEQVLLPVRDGLTLIRRRAAGEA